MGKTNLQVAFDTWGPIKIIVDNRTQELWGKVSRESLRLAFIELRGSRVRTQHWLNRTKTNLGKLCLAIRTHAHHKP